MNKHERIMETLEGIVEPRGAADPEALGRFSLDGSAPAAVVFPSNTRQLAEVMRCAAGESLAVVPWGSGTKIHTGNPPARVDLVVCLSRMNHLLDVDVANLTITVEAGVKFRDIQARLATEEDRCYLPLEDLATDAGEFICSDRSHSGCFLPLDPPFSRRASMGGIIATNSTGPRRLLYGLPRDLLLGVRFVTPQGKVIGAGGKTVKNVSGYDISKLMIGSYGTLGVLSEMTLRLLPLPERMETLLLAFDGFDHVQDFVNRVFQTRLLPAALEVCNRAAFRRLHFQGAADFAPARYVVMVALEAFSEAVERMRREMLVMADLAGARSRAVVEEADHGSFWLGVSDLTSPAAGDSPDLIEIQLNFPLSEWGNLFLRTEQTLHELGPECALLCHAGSGVLSALLFPAEQAAAAQAVGELLAACRQAGGNLLVRRAPRRLKPELPIWGEAGGDLKLMQRIRGELDPKGLMNPGRFFVSG